MNFKEIPGVARGSLPLPAKSDTLEGLARKMDSLREIVEGGHSLAVATGLQATAHGTTDPVEFAKGEMSSTELRQYQQWESGARLKAFDPETCKEPVTKWKGSEKSLLEWLAGLQRMYSDPTLVKENVVWWAVRADYLVPAIMAYRKLLGAERGLTNGGGDLTANELAEYQTARKIQSEATFRTQTIMKQIHDINRRIDDGVKAVQTRVRFYEPRIKTKPRGEAPLNKQRASMNLPKYGAPSNLQTLGKRTRQELRETVAGPAAQRQRVGTPEYAPASPVMSGGRGYAPPGEGGEMDTDDVVITGTDDIGVTGL